MILLWAFLALISAYDYKTDILDHDDKNTTHPCLQYESPNKCLICDNTRGYYLLLRNVTHTMCGYYKHGET